MEQEYFTKFTKIIFFACYEDIFNAAKWRDVALVKGVYSSIGFFRNLVLCTNDVTNRDSDV